MGSLRRRMVPAASEQRETSPLFMNLMPYSYDNGEMRFLLDTTITSGWAITKSGVSINDNLKMTTSWSDLATSRGGTAWAKCQLDRSRGH